VDVGREWIRSYAKQRPSLAAALVDDTSDQSVRKRAKHTVHKWRAACEWRVGELRRTQAIRSQMSMSHLHRLATDLMRALITKHETFATFLSEPVRALFVLRTSIALACAADGRALAAGRAAALADVHDPHHHCMLPIAREHLDVRRLPRRMPLLPCLTRMRRVSGTMQKP
jgi:hypothetical protein